MNLVGFVIRIYHDARSSERKIPEIILPPGKPLGHIYRIYFIVTLFLVQTV